MKIVSSFSTNEILKMEFMYKHFPPKMGAPQAILRYVKCKQKKCKWEEFEGSDLG